MRRELKAQLVAVCVCVLAATALKAQYIATESEPNETSATANPLTLTNGSARVRASVFPNADIDFYSFAGNAGDVVFAAVMTSGSASVDSQLRLIDTDGSTLIELDQDDGTFGSTSSSIAGATLVSTGTHFIQVSHFSATGQLRPYDLYFRLVPAATVFATETEPNDIIATANVLGPDLVASGAVTPAADVDFYSLDLAAGDTVFVSLDLDPERDGITFNARMAWGPFGGFMLLANDASVTSPNSEAGFFTVQTAGTYSIFVDESAGTPGAATNTYRMSVSVFPYVTVATPATYSAAGPTAIPAATGVVTSVINIPTGVRIGRLSVALDITHTTFTDLDIYLTSPAGTMVHLLSDINSTAGANCILDAYAAIPPAFSVLQDQHIQPELQGRLEWFNGQTSQGTWTLSIAVDLAGAGGTLNAFSLIIEEEPISALAVAPYTLQTFLNADFEAGDNGFTHSGTLDEWERGTPVFAPLTSAFGGTNCWTA